MILFQVRHNRAPRVDANTDADQRCARRAFTLTEMLVALFVIVVVLGVVSSVFSITAKTAALSTAAADAETQVRSLMSELKADLEQCDPRESILVIQGRTVPAALTEDQRQAGQYWRVLTGNPDPRVVPTNYDPRLDDSLGNPNGGSARDQFSDPRADILMFFTARAVVSKDPAAAAQNTGGVTDYQRALIRGTEVSPVQVVYGHAAIDTAAQRNGVWRFSGNERHIEQTSGGSDLSQLPANRWQLVRRATLLDSSGVPTTWDPRDGFLTDNDTFARITRLYGGDLVSGATTVASDWAPFDLGTYLDLFSARANAQMALRSPYDVPVVHGTMVLDLPAQLRWTNVQANWINSVLFPNDNTRQYHHIATVIEEPPSELRSNLGLRAIASCPWFKVEFLMPEDPRNSCESPLADQRHEMLRWVEVPDDQIYVFVPDTEENRELVRSKVAGSGAPYPDQPLANSRLSTFKLLYPPASQGGLPNITLPAYDKAANRRVRMWPYAIRVTVKVADPRGRMEQPITHSFVHWFD